MSFKAYALTWICELDAHGSSLLLECLRSFTAPRLTKLVIRSFGRLREDLVLREWASKVRHIVYIGGYAYLSDLLRAFKGSKYDLIPERTVSRFDHILPIDYTETTRRQRLFDLSILNDLFPELEHYNVHLDIRPIHSALMFTGHVRTRQLPISELAIARSLIPYPIYCPNLKVDITLPRNIRMSDHRLDVLERVYTDVLVEELKIWLDKAERKRRLGNLTMKVCSDDESSEWEAVVSNGGVSG